MKNLFSNGGKMKKRYTVGCLTLLLILAGANALAAKRQPSMEKTRKVKVYLVKVGDKGKSGKKIGCDDSLYSVTRTVTATGAPLKAALEELLSMSNEEGNYWKGENLKVEKASIIHGAANIYITGNGPQVAGVCDEPRIESQIEATARQFPNVKRVIVYVNGEPLRYAIR
jgi:Sporulation and spore germination